MVRFRLMKLILSGMIFLSRLTLLLGDSSLLLRFGDWRHPSQGRSVLTEDFLKSGDTSLMYFTAHNIYSQTEHSISEKHLIFNYLILLLCQKSLGYLRSCPIKIFSKLPTENIVKLNFWLVICIAKNFIWSVPASCSRQRHCSWLI